MKTQLMLLAITVPVLLASLGCGNGAPPDTRKFGKVSGKITVKGAALGGGMQVVFLPATGEKGSYADVGADGTYATEAVAGTNQVYLVASVGADGNYSEPEKLGILKQYLDIRESGLAVDIPEGGEAKQDFEVGQ